MVDVYEAPMPGYPSLVAPQECLTTLKHAPPADMKPYTHRPGHSHDADVAVEAAGSVHVDLLCPEDHLGVDNPAPRLLVTHSLS